MNIDIAHKYRTQFRTGTEVLKIYKKTKRHFKFPKHKL